VIVDVSKKLIDQFAANLQQVITAQGSAQASADSAGTPAGSAPVTPAPAPVKAADSIDLLGTAGTPVLKRALPVIIGIVVVAGIVWWIASR